jgi:ABC-type uncharacterized transport system involved in gliding motility auxiliary subunit
VKIALLSLLLIAGVFCSNKWLTHYQWDATQENLYTLSDSSQQIVSKLPKPVKIELFYSKTAANKGTEQMRSFNSYFEFIRDLCRQLVKSSGGTVTLEVIDPRPNTEQEDLAMSYGLKKFNLSASENYFFGIVASSEEGKENSSIAFLDPERQEKLEYEILRMITKVSEVSPHKKVGVYSSLPVISSRPGESWLIAEVLKDLHEVIKVDADFTSLAGLDLLILIHPKDMSDEERYLVDQYVVKGGRVLLLLDPHSIVDRSGAFNPYKPSMASNLPELLTSWGLELLAGNLVGDLNLAAMGQLSVSTPTIKLLPIINCDGRCTENLKQPMTMGLDSLSFYYPGALRTKIEGKELRSQVLVQTTNEANVYQANFQELNDPSILLERFIKGSVPIPLAFKIMGRFKSAYSENKSKGHMSISKDEGAIIAFSDVDFISDQVAFSQTELGVGFSNDNAVIFLNAVEELLGQTDLMSIRSKGRFNRNFDLIDSLEVEAQLQTKARSEKIKADLEQFQKKLDGLEGSATGNTKNAALEKERKELIAKMVTYRSELREIRRQEREKIETIGKVLQYFNTLAAPALFSIVGLLVYFRRKKNISKML